MTKMYYQWTEEALCELEELFKTKDIAEVMEWLGLSEAAIRSAAKTHGISVQNKSKVCTREDTKLIIWLHHKRHTNEEIAAITGKVLPLVETKLANMNKSSWNYKKLIREVFAERGH